LKESKELREARRFVVLSAALERLGEEFVSSSSVFIVFCKSDSAVDKASNIFDLITERFVRYSVNAGAGASAILQL
jgi:hypothetical protein